MPSPIAKNPSLAQLLENRRATFHFSSEPVADQDLDEILRLGSLAPSGYNLQPWRFLVIRDPANRLRLQKAAYDQAKVSEAPVVVIFLGMKEQTGAWAPEVFAEGVRRGVGRPENMQKSMEGALGFIARYGWEKWVTKHSMIAFTTMMLAAESLGYDTAPMEGFDPAAVKKEFEIPEEAEVLALLAIGRAREPDKKFGGRLPLARIAFSEKFGEPWKTSGDPARAAGPEGIAEFYAKGDTPSPKAGGPQQGSLKCCGEG